MVDFPIHSEANHPADAAEIIGKVKSKYGFVPNLLGALAEAPPAAEAYLALGDAVGASSFTPTERHVVWFTINAYHECHYCMAAHTGIAKMEKIPEDVIETARSGGDYADPKLQALKMFTVRMLDARGWPTDADLEELFAAGYAKRTVLEVILAIAHKTISNYTNHVVQTPIDQPFQAFEWASSKSAA